MKMMSHQQLHHKVAEQLRKEIHAGVYKPDDWLRQREISERLGVSQMPVREALKELASEGLVEHLPYRGARVVAYSKNDIEDLYAHRNFLEGRAARSAAKAITPEEIKHLKELNQQMTLKIQEHDLPGYRRLNREFHQTVYCASRSQYLIRSLNQIWSAFPSMLWGNFPETAKTSSPSRDAWDSHEHTEIIHALESHKANLAQSLMEEHIKKSGQHLSAALQYNSTIGDRNCPQKHTNN